MTRRRLALIGFIACILLVALVPWTVSSERVVSALARQITQGYGITLTSKGRLTLTLLPLPQLVLSGVRLESRDRSVEVEADELRAQLQFLPLLQARLRLRKLWLAKSNIAVTLAEEPTPTVAGTLAMLRSLLGTETSSGWAPRIDRFILTEADIGLRDGTGREFARLKRTSLILNSPEPGGALDLTAAAHWNGEAVVASLSGLNLAAIRGGLPQDVEAEITGALGNLSLDGRLTWSDKPLFAGTFKGKTISLSRLVRWSGLGWDLRHVERAVSVEAGGSLGLDKLQWPRASIEVGRHQLDGALAFEFGPKPQLRGTLAAGDLDLAWLGDVIDPAGEERFGANYDVRLSASALGFGPVRLREAAISVQATPRSVEVSLGRASYAGGSLRGRVSATLDGEARDIRALGWIDGVDLERALQDMSVTRFASGIATGQISLDIAGDRAESLAKLVRGRGSILTRDGELSLPAVVEPAKRGSQAQVPADWRSGRLRFSQTSLGFELHDSRAELTGGSIETTASKAALTGSVDLRTRNTALRLLVQPLSPASAPPVILDLNGPLQKLTLGSVQAP